MSREDLLKTNADVVGGYAAANAAKYSQNAVIFVFANPLHEVSLRALHEGLAPHSLGTLAGLRGPVSLAPLYLVVAGLCGALLCGRDGRDWAPTLAAASLAAAVVMAGYARLPRSGPESEEIWRFIRSTWEPIR